MVANEDNMARQGTSATYSISQHQASLQNILRASHQSTRGSGRTAGVHGVYRKATTNNAAQGTQDNNVTSSSAAASAPSQSRQQAVYTVRAIGTGPRTRNIPVSTTVYTTAGPGRTRFVVSQSVPSQHPGTLTFVPAARDGRTGRTRQGVPSTGRQGQRVAQATQTDSQSRASPHIMRNQNRSRSTGIQVGPAQVRHAQDSRRAHAGSHDLVNITRRQASSASSSGNPTIQSVPSTSAAMTLSTPPQTHRIHVTNEALPDLLNSHQLPPYTLAMRPNQHRPARREGNSPVRGMTRLSGQQTQVPNPNPTCCGQDYCFRCLTSVTTFRWVLVSLALLGVCSVVTGIILGALHMTVGSSFLTLSLMFIGLGLMLVVIVAVGWKCTPQGHEPCHMLFGLGNYAGQRSSIQQSQRRDHRDWHGGIMYPEFRFRRPPPSYQASMEQFQNRPVPPDPPSGQDDSSLPSSPPPTYRSRASTARPGLHIAFPHIRNGELPRSRPPSYRSHISSESASRARTPPLIDGSHGVDNPAFNEPNQMSFNPQDTIAATGEITVEIVPRPHVGSAAEDVPGSRDEQSQIHQSQVRPEPLASTSQVSSEPLASTSQVSSEPLPSTSQVHSEPISSTIQIHSEPLPSTSQVHSEIVPSTSEDTGVQQQEASETSANQNEASVVQLEKAPSSAQQENQTGSDSTKI